MAGWLFAAAVAIRLAALAILGLAPETFEYEDQARSLLAGQGYRRVYLGTPYLAQGPPLFGFLCAGLYWLFGDSPLSVILVQVAASSLIPVVIARLATEVGLGRELGLVAGVLAVVHPGLIIYAVRKLHPLSLDALFISLTVLMVMRLRAASGPGPALRAGGVLGLAALSRPTVALFALPAAAWRLLVAPQRGRPRAAAGVALFLAAAAAVVLPWTARNYLVFHRFVFITTDTAELFWRGSNPVATGSAFLPDGRWIVMGAPDAFQKAIRERDELERADLFRETARAFVREHPTAFVRLVVRKWVSFWWFPATAGMNYPARWMVIYKTLYAVVLTVSVLGLIAAWILVDRHRRQGLLLVLAMLACVSVAQSLYYVDVRHRWGVEPLLGIFLAFAVGWWRQPPGERQGCALDGPAAAA